MVFKHKDPCTTLTQAEYIAACGDGHIFACQATGDILYASSATVLSKLAKGNQHEILSMGGSNIPAWTASPSVTDLTISGGCITLSAATDIDLLDNNSSALSFDATGKAGIIDIVTTDCSEGVTMSGTLGVTGALTATAGITVGSDGSGADVTFHSATGSDNFLWDSSCEKLVITGTNGQTALCVADGNVVIADTLYFYDAGGEYISSNGSVLAITGATTISSTLGVTGAVTANAGVVVDNFTLDGTELDLSTGNFTLDVACDIEINADGGCINFKDGSLALAAIVNTSCVGELRIHEAANFVGFKTPALTGNTTYTLPAAYAACTGMALTSTDAGVMSWAAAGGVVSGGTDNAILRADCTGGSTSQGSPVTIADTTGTITLPAAGQVISGTGDEDTPGFSFVGDLNTGMYRPACHELAFTTNGYTGMRLDGSELRVGADLGTANSNMGTGISICQNGCDNEILAFKSGDVGHALTCVTEADTYGFIKKAGGTGGLLLHGIGPVDSLNFMLLATADAGSIDTSKSTGGNGNITLCSALESSNDRAASGSNANLVSIRDNGTNRFIFDAEGSGHADVEWTTYSDGRLKTNRSDSPYGLDTLLQLQPQIYCRDSGYLECGSPVLEGTPFRHIGFIAQEVRALIPEIVKDVCENVSWYSLEDGKLTAVVVKAIQELNDKVTALEAK